MLGLNPDFGSIRNSHRDVFYKGDCDDGCIELAAELGWDQELIEMMETRNREIALMRRKESLSTS